MTSYKSTYISEAAAILVFHFPCTFYYIFNYIFIFYGKKKPPFLFRSMFNVQRKITEKTAGQGHWIVYGGLNAHHTSWH